MQAVEWMTAEQAAKHFGVVSAKAFEKTVWREGIPKHYLSARIPRYNRGELDAWLMDRRQGGGFAGKTQEKKVPGNSTGDFWQQ